MEQNCLSTVCYAGESSSEVKIEADSNDITERPDNYSRAFFMFTDDIIICGAGNGQNFLND